MIEGLLMNTEEINQLWAEVCSRVKSYEGIIGPQVDALFSQLFPQAASDGFMMLTANTEFIKNFIERHYIDCIKRALEEIRGVPFDVLIGIDESQAPAPQAAPAPAAAPAPTAATAPAAAPAMPTAAAPVAAPSPAPQATAQTTAAAARRRTANSPRSSGDAGNRSAGRDAGPNDSAAQPRPAGSPGACLHCSTGYRNGAASNRCPRCCSRKRTGATSCSDTRCSQPGRSRPAGHLDR